MGSTAAGATDKGTPTGLAKVSINQVIRADRELVVHLDGSSGTRFCST